MARPEKVAVVEEIRTKLAEADAAVLTEYRGLTVPELADAAGVAARIGHRVQGVQEHAGPPGGRRLRSRRRRVDVRGPGGDRLRARRRGERGQGAARLRAQQPGARAEGRPARRSGSSPPVEIEALAELPSRDVLLAQVAGAFQAPLTKAAGLFQAFTRNFAYGVKALIDQRGGVPEAEPTAEPKHREAEAPRRGRSTGGGRSAEAGGGSRRRDRSRRPSRKRRQTPKLRQPTRPHQNPNRLSPSNRRTATWRP